MEKLKQELHSVAEELSQMAQRVGALISAVEAFTPPDAVKEAPGKAGTMSEAKAKNTGGRPRTQAKAVRRKAGAKPRRSPSPQPAPSDRQKVMRTIRNMRKKGASFDKIAQHLESKGVPTFSGRGKWRKQTVHKLFQQSA